MSAADRQRQELPAYPTNPLTWLWFGLHVIIMVVVWFASLILPVRFVGWVLVGLVVMSIHWAILKECIISVMEKRSEIPGYVVTSMPCSTYLYGVPSQVLGYDYHAVRDCVIALTGTSAIVALSILLLVAPNPVVARLPQRARIVVTYVVTAILIWSVQKYDRRMCSAEQNLV